MGTRPFGQSALAGFSRASRSTEGGGAVLAQRDSGIAKRRREYFFAAMSVLTCILPSALNDRLADLAKRRGVAKSVLVREAIEAKIAGEAALRRRGPANLTEALGGSIGSIASRKRDLTRNKDHLKGYGR